MTAGGRDEPRVALKALVGPEDPERRERLVRAIMARVAPELRRRAARRGALATIGSLARPAFAAAALILLVSAAAIGSAAGRGTLAPRLAADVEDVLQPGGAAAAWLTEGRGPSVDDLLVALHEGAR